VKEGEYLLEGRTWYSKLFKDSTAQGVRSQYLHNQKEGITIGGQLKVIEKWGDRPGEASVKGQLSRGAPEEKGPARVGRESFKYTGLGAGVQGKEA